jgi:hypothetical protein
MLHQSMVPPSYEFLDLGYHRQCTFAWAIVIPTCSALNFSPRAQAQVWGGQKITVAQDKLQNVQVKSIGPTYMNLWLSSAMG